MSDMSGIEEDATLSELGICVGKAPRVARSAQPWAKLLNPVGIRDQTQINASDNTCRKTDEESQSQNGHSPSSSALLETPWLSASSAIWNLSIAAGSTVNADRTISRPF